MIIPIPIIPPILLPITIPLVPFYSQFKDIECLSWRKVGCGIASLAMIIDYYSKEKINVEDLLQTGISSGAYDNRHGWIHQGLINIAKSYDLIGSTYNYSTLSEDSSITKLKELLEDGPVMASIFYKFNPKSTIPHLIVVDGIYNNTVYYNDPSAKGGQKEIPIADFQKGWKRKVIVIRPIKIKEKEVA